MATLKSPNFLLELTQFDNQTDTIIVPNTVLRHHHLLDKRMATVNEILKYIPPTQEIGEEMLMPREFSRSLGSTRNIVSIQTALRHYDKVESKLIDYAVIDTRFLVDGFVPMKVYHDKLMKEFKEIGRVKHYQIVKRVIPKTHSR